MTDEPRRRTNDVEAADLYPKVEEAIDHLARLEVAVKTHGHPQLEESVGQIIDVLEGPEVHQPFGQPPTRNDGLVDAVAGLTRNLAVQGADIAEIKATIGNGGVKIKLPAGAWVAIAVATIGGLATVIAAIASRT